MFIKQLSIFVENKNGRLETIIDTLSKNGINISALPWVLPKNAYIYSMPISSSDKTLRTSARPPVLSSI